MNGAVSRQGEGEKLKSEAKRNEDRKHKKVRVVGWRKSWESWLVDRFGLFVDDHGHTRN